MEKGNITAPSTMVYMVENNGIYGTTIFTHDLLPSYSPHGLPIDVNLLCHPSSPSLLFLRPSQQHTWRKIITASRRRVPLGTNNSGSLSSLKV